MIGHLYFDGEPEGYKYNISVEVSDNTVFFTRVGGHSKPRVIYMTDENKKIESIACEKNSITVYLSNHEGFFEIDRKTAEISYSCGTI